MSTLAFDNYGYINSLKDSGLSEQQARAIADGLLEFGAENLISKQDLLQTQHSLEERLTELRIEMLKMKNQLLWWILTLIVAQTAAFAGFVQMAK